MYPSTAELNTFIIFDYKYDDAFLHVFVWLFVC